ncbi:hypothetical protein Sango_1252300 [Sesamum angolense]|uniref:Uncharacterized protein n=1 Tax=Sesamum angolense TaxID=2727404 RepID=A0AAE1WRA4_9LAMI|nr:hypothetical protein Sango_1252300 [Sesamum angolense]
MSKSAIVLSKNTPSLEEEGGWFLGMLMVDKHNKHLGLPLVAWRVSTTTVSLVYRLFKAQYFSRTTLVDALGKGSISYAWRSILSARPLLQFRCRWRIYRSWFFHMDS